MTLWRTSPRMEGFQRSTPSWRPWAASLTALVLACGVSVAAHAQGAGKLTTPLSVEWKYTGTYFGNNPASPVIVKDTAYFVTGNHVYAVNLASGALKWRYP